MAHNLDFPTDLLQVLVVQIRLVDDLDGHAGLGQSVDPEADKGEVALAYVARGEVVQSDPHQATRF